MIAEFRLPTPASLNAFLRPVTATKTTLEGRWLKDEQGRLYCQWIKVEKPQP